MGNVVLKRPQLRTCCEARFEQTKDIYKANPTHQHFQQTSTSTFSDCRVNEHQISDFTTNDIMTRSRYFKQAVKRRPVFQWTSDPVAPTKGREDNVHFSSFKLDSMNINIGDFVLVRNTDSWDFAEVRTLL